MAYKQFALIQTVGPIRRAKLSEVARLTEGVGKLLADWPNNFVAFLKRSLPTQDCDKSSSVVTTYNSLYRRLYHEFALSKFDFIRQVFEQFMLEHWKWGARGVPNWLPAKSREKLAWYSTDEAATTTALSTTKIKHLVESGEVDGYVVRAGRILDYRVGKQSLRDWDTRQAALIPRLDLARLLGLSFKSIMGLADSKVIRYAPNTQTTRHFFVREDGLRLLQAFERHEVPVISVWNKATVLTLSEAKKTILEPHERFASALQAVIDGSLVPVARTKLYPGIGGYIFSAVDLQIHCRPTGSAEGFAMHLNVSQSAQYLGIGRTGVEGLISSNHLRPTGERICKGFREFQIPLTQLESFANRFVSTKSAAERLGMTTKSLVDRLRERAIPFLAVQMKREGHRTLFIPKRVADGLQLPLDRLDNAGHHQSRKEDIAA
jgi:hypothetical protein